MRVCLQLDKLKHRSNEEFEHFNWLPVTYRSKQFVNYAMQLSISMSNAPNYLNEVFDVATESKF